MKQQDTDTNEMSKVRIDKWLWAARFFKTRSLAKQAIEGGKVHVDGQRVKPSKDICCGQVLTIRQGFLERDIEVIALSEQRRGAPEAAKLYQETEASIEKNNLLKEQRRAMGPMANIHDSRPTKKQRRQIHKFKSIHDDN